MNISAKAMVLGILLLVYAKPSHSSDLVYRTERDCVLSEPASLDLPKGFDFTRTCHIELGDMGYAPNDRTELSFVTKQSLILPNVCMYSKITFFGDQDEVRSANITKLLGKHRGGTCPEYGSASYVAMAGVIRNTEAAKLYDTLQHCFAFIHQGKWEFDQCFADMPWYSRPFSRYGNFKDDFLHSHWEEQSMRNIWLKPGGIIAVGMSLNGHSCHISVRRTDNPEKFRFVSKKCL